MHKNGTRNIDRIIKRQIANKARRRVANGGKTVRQHHARRYFNVGNQPHQNVVEFRDLIIGELFGSEFEEVADISKRLDAVSRSAVLQSMFHAADESLVRNHDCP